MGSNVSAKCKKCGNSVKVEELKLDTTFGMVVCSKCIGERMRKDGIKKLVPEEKKEPTKARPAGWDADDEELERAHNKRLESRVLVQRIDEERVWYPCPKCNHTFKYTIKTKMPSSCPLCNERIHPMRT